MLRTLLMFLMLSLSSLALAEDQQKPLVLNTYDDAIKAMQKYDAPGIFVFWAKWCEPCKKMQADVWQPLMPKLRPKYIVYYVNVDAEPKVVEQWKKLPKMPKSIPAYVIVSEGAKKVVAYGEGYRNRATFIEWLNVSIDNWRQPKTPQPSPGGG